MKPILLFLIAFGLSIQMHAQYREYIISRSLESQQYDIRLPFSWENGKLVVHVEIEGDSLRFIFDTGALCVMKASLAEKYDLKEFRQGSLTDANNAKKKSSLVHIPQMKVDGVDIDTIPAVILSDDNFLFNCLEVDGILGSNVLIGSEVDINYERKEISIKPSSGDTLGGRMTVSSQNTPYFELDFGGKKAWFLFDSGANAFGDISPKTRRKLKRQLNKVYEAEGISGFSALGHDKPEKIDYYHSASLQAGPGASFTGVFAVDHENRLGTKMLEQGNVKLDFKTKSWAFTPNGQDTSSLAFPNIIPLRIDGALIVGKKSASLDKVSVGDRIVKIAGIKLEEYTNCKLIKGEASQMLIGKAVDVQTRKGIVSIVVEKQKVDIPKK
jgi:hypothetical protein